MVGDRFTLETTASAEGTLFRGEHAAPDGHLVDATVWTRHPAQAIKDLARLKDGSYRADQRRRDDVGEPFARCA